MKSEPGTFGIDDLARAPRRRTAWDGVRNYQARNFLRAMERGDEAFFYHSSCALPGVVGRMRVVREAYPDPGQFDPADPHYDAGSRKGAPRWYAVDVALVERFAEPVTLQRLRAEESVADLLILRRGNRLSVTPVTSRQWRSILEMVRSSD